jgi:hypothetical protein
MSHDPRAFRVATPVATPVATRVATPVATPVQRVATPVAIYTPYPYGRCDTLGECRTPLEDLADRVARLNPSRRDPHAFHEDKSAIVGELRALARGYPIEGRGEEAGKPPPKSRTHLVSGAR